MNLSEKIYKRIDKIPKGKTFGYKDLPILKDQYVTAAKTLERLQKKGTIKKVSKGVFYKPEETVFGELKPNKEEILKPYLFKDGKRIAYITGATLYNQLRLTRQVAARIKIASRNNRIYVKNGAIKATPVKSYVDVTDDNYRLLGLLDALKDFKKIPDNDKNASISILGQLFNQLSKKELSSIISYALKYPPRTRALLGAILEKNNLTIGLKKLKDSLNPLTTFTLNLNESELPTKNTWNIE